MSGGLIFGQKTAVFWTAMGIQDGRPPCWTSMWHHFVLSEMKKIKIGNNQLGDILWQQQYSEHGEKCADVKYLAPEKVENSSSCDIIEEILSILFFAYISCFYLFFAYISCFYPLRLPPWPWLPGSSAPPPPSRSQRWTTWVMTSLVIKVNWL